MKRCSKCTHPTVDTPNLFGDAKIIVCEQCAPQDVPEYMTVRARADGGMVL